MSDTNTQTAETTTERKPPTLADIVREKTDDGKRIIDFFLDVMEDRIDGAELCHRMDAAKQLEKHKSKAAARFLAKYRGVPCGHSTRGRPNPADPCSNADATGRESAPGPFTEDLLSVLSAVDEDLMARLVRAQTADGSTVIEFLDNVMQDRNDGFRPHHRIAAAKELIVHIVRDEQPESVPGEAPQRAEAPKHEWPASILWPEEYKFIHSRALENPREILARADNDPDHPLHGYFKDYKDIRASIESVGGFLGPDGLLTTLSPPKGPTQTVIPAEAGTHPRREPAEGPQDKARRPRTQRSRDGAARAATLGKGPKRNNEEEQDKPAPVELTIAERRIKERLEQHWHEPDPWTGPIDSTHPGRSPPLVTATRLHN